MRAQPSRRSGPARPARRRSVYFFGDGRAAGRASMRELLGGKGANLAEMTRLGVPVPAGFTISTEVCREFNRRGGRLPASVKAEALDALRRVEKVMGGRFGDRENPLLVSVRSGARVSMPGMMDTVLNLGLNDETVQGLAKQSGDARFAFDSYRRFIQMYGNVVLGIELAEFESRLEALKQRRGKSEDAALDAEALQTLIRSYKKLVHARTGREFPDDPEAQLWGATAAVFHSWNTARAIEYRRLHEIPDDWGTAVNVQAMVFGNLGEDSATGVAFTRDPSTGEKYFFGEYLPRAQGEDVVAGIRTPRPISREGRKAGASPSLEETLPACYRELRRVARLLERHYRDMQDLEFTVQRGKLWMLQTRSGKRTGRAAVKIAVDMVRERLIDRRTALLRVEPTQLDQLLHPTLDASAAPPPIGQGLPASPGAASGHVVFTAEAAESRATAGEDVILVRPETSPEDIHGMTAARGILTALGGMTSHAAVVARGMGKCCITGCAELRVNVEQGRATLGGVEFCEGDVITLDGATGYVFKGRVPTVEAELSGEFRTLMRWADQVRRLRVRTNADTPGDAAQARRFGAEGIGLCRTEHMFFRPERILAVRRMILADTADERARALEQILPMQREDFIGIFHSMDGLPVTIRLLDPPLHEFLPHTEEESAALAHDLGVPTGELLQRIEALHEFNPMLGHRGCRLGVTYPEIYEVQARAIIEAACACAAEGRRPRPEIMIPLVADVRELRMLRERIDRVAKEVLREKKRRLRYTVGTMIEVPRAALTAARVAEVAEFFSFGTNDLTQMTLALSRDDAGRFLPSYLEAGIFEADPFVTLDREGVGALVQMASAAGRRVRPDLKLGICGEHGGDPRSVGFCEEVGLDYVSCSPFRVPIARLAAARAVLERSRRR
ncbi:MAG: pyruvate, phosphate dikinase [Myxococcota bacterium]